MCPVEMQAQCKEHHYKDVFLHSLFDFEFVNHVARLLDRAAKEGRADDNEETIRRRMEVYAGQTAPLLFHYESHGLLVEVEGTGTVAEVRQRMLAAVAERVAGA